MSSFSYEAPRPSPFALTIGQMIEQAGQIQAQRAERLGAIQAQNAQAQGQIWGGAIQNIGQTIGQIPGQIQQAQRQGVQDELQRNRLTQEQQVMRGQGAVDSMMRGDQLPAGDTGPRQESYLTADGLFDVPKM